MIHSKTEVIRVPESDWEHHLNLGASGITPQAVIPTDDFFEDRDNDFSFPVERIRGALWSDLLDEGSMSLDVHLRISLIVVKQMIFLRDHYGVYLRDRDPLNVIIVDLDDIRSDKSVEELVISSVRHKDLEFVEVSEGENDEENEFFMASDAICVLTELVDRDPLRAEDKRIQDAIRDEFGAFFSKARGLEKVEVRLYDLSRKLENVLKSIR